MKLKVTQKHIDKAKEAIRLYGEHNREFLCPIRWAVQEHFNLTDRDRIKINNTIKINFQTVGFPTNTMGNFIHAFDKGKEVKPTNFNVPLNWITTYVS